MPNDTLFHDVLVGDAREQLASLAPESVQTVVTSPPYWGLRDYGVDGQLGAEASPEEYVNNLVAVFSEMRRVLKVDGTFWINLGDSYYGNLKGSGGTGILSAKQNTNRGANFAVEGGRITWPRRTDIKAKDLVGIPWMVAFALRADGWFLRSDIVWNKPNVMPESVRDRPTKSHEYLFLLTKNARYYYNQDAIREPVSPVSIARLGRAVSNQNKYVAGAPGQPVQHTMNRPRENTNSYKRIEGKAPTAFEGGDHLVAPFDVERGRNKRTVWTIPTASYRRAHFATFPEKLVEPCVLAGSRPGDIVLDPFCGSGTTLAVAKRLGRSSIGIDLNPDYLGLIMERLDEVPSEEGAVENAGS